jgi:hypothetical protein
VTACAWSDHGSINSAIAQMRQRRYTDRNDEITKIFSWSKSVKACLRLAVRNLYATATDKHHDDVNGCPASGQEMDGRMDSSTARHIATHAAQGVQ